MSTISAVKKPHDEFVPDEGVELPLSVPPVSDALLKKMTNVFKLLADKSRLKIVLALAENEKMHVSALCQMLEQSQPAVSHHLTLMRNVGLVDYDRSGKHNYYYLASDHMADLFDQFFQMTRNPEQRLTFDTFSLLYSRE